MNGNSRAPERERHAGTIRWYEEKLELTTNGERVWFWTAFAVLVLYMEFVTYAQHSAYGGNTPLLDIMSAVAVIPLCLVGVFFFHKIRFCRQNLKERRRNRERGMFICLAVFTITFLYCFAWQKSYWPGSFSNDSLNQYNQAKTGVYSDWQPTLHTWLFFTLPNKLHADPAMIVTMQIIWFSAAVAYLFIVLYSNGASVSFLIISLVYILSNPNTTYIMLYPWKDSAFSIFSLVVFAQVLQIYVSRGEWLKRWYNLVSFILFCFLALNMRHNAVLLVVPLLLIMLAFCGKVRGRVILSLFLILAGTGLMKGPVYEAMDVEVPGLSTVETAGLPMTVLGNIYTKDKESLPQDIKEFLDSVATEEQWNGYVTGNFNSIKWSGINSDIIEEQGLPTMIRYMVRAWERSPQYAWEAFVALTKMVWSVDGGGGWGVGHQLDENPYGIEYHDRNERLLNEIVPYSGRASQYITKYLYRYIGITIVFLLFLAVSHIGKRNLGRAFVVLALMAYDFGTMLLLTGPDFRFFYLNFLLVVPVAFLVASEKHRSHGVDNGDDGHDKEAALYEERWLAFDNGEEH